MELILPPSHIVAPAQAAGIKQCCQVAEIPAKKLKRGRRKKKSWPKEFVAEFWLILPKSGRKGAAENFHKKFLLAVITTFNVHEDEIKLDF
jgi:hypothetical protein